MTKKVIAALILFLAVSGCTSARISSQLASGVIGCPPEEIIITNETAGVSGLHNWIAECHGKKYVCSYVYGSTTTCKEIVPDSQGK